MRAFQKVKDFLFGDRDPVKQLMKDYHVETEGELMEILDKKEIKKITLLFTTESEGKYTVSEVKEVLNMLYSHRNFDAAKEAIVSKNKELVSKLNVTVFEPRGDYLKFFQIKTSQKKVFIMAVIFPFDPFQATDRIWLYEIDEVYW